MSNDGACLSCKLISFAGLTASGVYVGHHARKQPRIFGKGVLGTFSICLMYTGVARLLNVYPFNEKRFKSSSAQNNG